MEFKLPPKLVGIVGRKAEMFLNNIYLVKEGVEISGNGRLSELEVLQEKGGTRVFVQCKEKGRGKISFWYDEKKWSIPYVVFREKEFFLCMVISSNFHYGYDPSQYQDADITKEICAVGTGFEKAEKELLPIYRRHGVMVTWLIDPITAFFEKEKVIRWHENFGDDYGVMPTSNFFWNAVNYNLDRSQEETDCLMEQTKRYTEYSFPFYTQIAGVDQWMGSIGSHFVKSCEEAGIKGLWGMGYDHGFCDNSMYHRGCPWDVYKMDRENYRKPDKDGIVWGFQWTVRDILNTVHTPGATSGSAIFSTDVDDIAFHNIMQTEPHYYARMLREYQKNMDRNDFFVFLVHQEDHDTHHMDGNRYYDAFLEEVLPDEEITPATMQEIVQWLELKYPKHMHPQQYIEMEDTLDDPAHVRFDSDEFMYALMPKPKDWGIYPPVVAYYDSNIQVFYERKANGWSAVPYRLYDYREKQEFEERGEWRAADWVYDLKEEPDETGKKLKIFSKEEIKKAPLLIRNQITYVDLKKGENLIETGE